MTKQQAQWAEQHDWHLFTVTHRDDGYVIFAVELLGGFIVPYLDDNQDQQLSYRFTDFQKLRDWAGY